MKKINAKQWCIVGGLLLSLVALLCINVLYDMESRQIVSDSSIGEGASLVFSHSSGFYDEDFVLELQDIGAECIYYTMDGSVPAKDNSNAFLYEDGIEITCENTERVYTIKAASYSESGIVLGKEGVTYITSNTIKERYDLLVLSISGDPYEFYNYEDGILVQGKKGDEYKAQHPEWKHLFDMNLMPVFGNIYQRGPASEREVFMTLFDEGGEVLLSQNCGFRVYGAFSRNKNQPSFKLYAREEYDTENDFNFLFFENQYSEKHTLIDDFKRVIVRNAGNDNGYGFIRSELANRLALEAGFPDASCSRPVLVYMNGEYYGVHWFITNYDGKYFEETYGEYTGEMYVYEGAVNQLSVDEEETDLVYHTLAKEYEEKEAFFAQADLTKEENWEALKDFIDVENFLEYVALENYFANKDSMSNNYRIYRYYSPTEEYTEGTVFDGRYRFLLFDVDALGHLNEYEYGMPETTYMTTERVNSTAPEMQLFANILRRKDCQDYYIRYTMGLLNYYCAIRNVEPILDDMHSTRAKELEYTCNETDILKGNYKEPNDTSFQKVLHEMGRIKYFFRERTKHVAMDLITAFGDLSLYSINIQNVSGASLQLDKAILPWTEFSGNYYKEIPLQLSVKAKPGYCFKHWIINGEVLAEKTVEITPEMILDGVVSIECVCVPDEDAELCITGVKTKGTQDYIELTNVGSEIYSLRNYYLSDDNEWNKSTLPNVYVAPGETVTVYCEDYSGMEALGKPRVNFNISIDENVFLYDLEGNVVSVIKAPELGHKDGVYRMDMQTGEFWEKYNEKR